MTDDNMTKEQILAQINTLSDEIDANEEENRIMQDKIETLYLQLDKLEGQGRSEG
ncbi:MULTISPECIES: hypothetical protein [Aeromonas]|uniref:hypothetical protein n=1 Tax=Aeromonas TaxID=642 RepID=UPI002B05F835|nr:hypothetical protein [Aeromonas jandaei]